MIPVGPERILFASHSSGTWGAERSMAELAIGLAARAKRSVTVAMPRPGPLARLLEPHGVTVRTANAQRWAAAIRRVPTRVLFGSDATTPTSTPGAAWAAMRKLLPLTDASPCSRSIPTLPPTYAFSMGRSARDSPSRLL